MNNIIDYYINDFDETKRLTQNDNRHLVELYRKRSLYTQIFSRYHKPRVLQIAAGTGVHTKWIQASFDVELYATDIVPNHVTHLKPISNITSAVWDCTQPIPDTFPEKFDIILVEGAWYHLEETGRKALLDNLQRLSHTSTSIIIDWLSQWHNYTQEMLRFKPAKLGAPQKSSDPFVYDGADCLHSVSDWWDGITELYLVDTSLRFGYIDLNAVPKTAFEEYMKHMNMVLPIMPACDALMHLTEHGCYVLTPIKEQE